MSFRVLQTIRTLIMRTRLVTSLVAILAIKPKPQPIPAVRHVVMYHLRHHDGWHTTVWSFEDSQEEAEKVTRGLKRDCPNAIWFCIPHGDHWNRAHWPARDCLQAQGV